jgi:hypothetical protein
MYPKLRTIHLLSGVFAIPALLMYGLSAVQMAHTKWFTMKPRVLSADVVLSPGYSDGRLLARDIMAARPEIRGELNSIQTTAAGLDLRIVVPGTVHEIHYDRATGTARVRTSIAGFMGMLNRLHHAAGLWPQFAALKIWGLFVGLVSLATVTLGATGIWMWWLRRQERKWGLLLILANLAFSLAVLIAIRSAGP